jgi:DNA helicase-4
MSSIYTLSNREISRSKTAGAILQLCGERYMAIKSKDAGLKLLAGGSKEMPSSKLSVPSKKTKKLGFTGISLPCRDGEIGVLGLKRAMALDFVSDINSAWHAHFIRQIEAVKGELRALTDVIERLRQPKRYPSDYLVEPFWARVNAMGRQLLQQETLQHFPLVNLRMIRDQSTSIAMVKKNG